MARQVASREAASETENLHQVLYLPAPKNPDVGAPEWPPICTLYTIHPGCPMSFCWYDACSEDAGMSVEDPLIPVLALQTRGWWHVPQSTLEESRFMRRLR